uniref:Late embryogenesis abundant protein LEA-2 subgroup domain-containing protein n=1 Tax=Leersia perrieri TaxID=77586 RepID=A0A0D9WZM2_9ORYZ
MTQKSKTKKHHKKACCLLLAAIVILGILALIFYLVYRPRPPRIVATPVDIAIELFSLVPPKLKALVGVHVVVYNPSNSPYRYGASLASVTYHGEHVGTSVIPAGEVGGKATSVIEPETAVDVVRVAESPHFADDAVAGVLPFVAVSRVEGKALVLQAFEVSVSVEVVCLVEMYVFRGESSSRCVSTVRTATETISTGDRRA